MSCGERLANELRSKGHRVTPQRAVILETIAHKNGHLCAQDIYTDARRKLPGLNLATVYRTVEVLHEAEMVDLFNDGSNPALFAMLCHLGISQLRRGSEVLFPRASSFPWPLW